MGDPMSVSAPPVLSSWIARFEDCTHRAHGPVVVSCLASVASKHSAACCSLKTIRTGQCYVPAEEEAHSGRNFIIA